MMSPKQIYHHLLMWLNIFPQAWIYQFFHRGGQQKLYHTYAAPASSGVILYIPLSYQPDPARFGCLHVLIAHFVCRHQQM